MDILLILLVIAILSVTFGYGYRKGFIRIAFSICISVISLFASFLVCGPAQSLIKNYTTIDEHIYKEMKVYVDKNMNSKLENETLTKDAQNEAIRKLNLPKSIEKKLMKSDTDVVKEGIKSSKLSENIARALTNMLIQIICFAFVFILLRIGLRVIAGTLGVLSQLPVVKDVNKLLGGMMGFAEGILIIWVLCIIVTAFGGTSWGQNTLNVINGNKILGFIYNSNIFLNLLFAFK